jgi:lysophospholipase L1-like esterase
MDEDASRTTGSSGRVTWPLRLLILLPALAHTALVALAAARHPFVFGRPDAAVFLAFMAYLTAAALALRSRRRALPFAFSVYTTLALFVALEAVATRAGARGPDHAMPRAPIARVAEAAPTMPGITGEIRYTVNSQGFRGPDIPIGSADLKILCIGGSTTECLYVTDEKSWPWLLETELARRTGRRVLVANVGKSGEMGLHHQYVLANWEAAREFDWVVLLAGINDAATVLRDNYDLRARRIAREALFQPPDGPYYSRFALLRLARLAFSGPPAGEWAAYEDPRGSWLAIERAKRKRAIAEGRVIGEVPPGLAAATTRYRGTLTSIIGLCRSRGQRILCLTQPTMYRAGMPAELADLIWEHVIRGAFAPEVLERVNGAFNDAMRETCAASGVPCVDLAAKIPKDTSAFYDDCHFNVEGCARVAGVVADFFAGEVAAGAPEQR